MIYTLKRDDIQCYALMIYSLSADAGPLFHSFPPYTTL